jgi:hypothetical protein
LVFTVVTYGTSSPCGLPLVRSFSSPGQQTRRSSRRTIGYTRILSQVRVNGQLAQVIWHPRSGRETQITAAQVLGHVQDIRIATRRVQKAIAAGAGDG